MPPQPRSLFVFALVYGGMVCMGGVLGTKQLALGPLAVEGGIFSFLSLVMMGSAVAELHGRATADMLVRIGFLPLVVSMLLIRLVLALPADPAMFPPLARAFPVMMGQSGRMMLAGLLAYGVSQTLNVFIFARLAGGSGHLLWLRAIAASVASQIVDTLIFITVSFGGERPIMGLMAGQMLAKIVLSLLLVPWGVAGLVRLGRRIDQPDRRAGAS